MSRIPKFFIAGAQKSGTTTLHNILVQHENIYLPKTKETKFFVDPEVNKLGLKKYKEFFKQKKSFQTSGEVDPDCFYFNYAAEEMFKILGADLKVFLILRNPAERAISHYLMSLRRGIEELSFEDAIACEDKRIKNSYYNDLHYSYINRGNYFTQVKRFYDVFGKDNVTVFIYEEDFLENRQELVNTICSKLGLDSMLIDVTISSNVARASKYPFITKILNSPNSRIRKLAKKIIPSHRFRILLREYLDTINSRKLNKIDKNLNVDFDSEYIFRTYYDQEIDMLENLIDRKLDCWKPTRNQHV